MQQPFYGHYFGQRLENFSVAEFNCMNVIADGI